MTTNLLDQADTAICNARGKLAIAQTNLHNLYQGVKENAIDKDTILRLLVETDTVLREIYPHGRSVDHFDKQDKA